MPYTDPLTIPHHPALRVARGDPPTFSGLDRGEVDLVVLLQPSKRTDQAVVAITRNRRALACPVGFQLLACDAQPLDPAAATQNRTTEHRGLQVDLQLLGSGLGLVICRAAFALSQP